MNKTLFTLHINEAICFILEQTFKIPNCKIPYAVLLYGFREVYGCTESTLDDFREGYRICIERGYITSWRPEPRPASELDGPCAQITPAGVNIWNALNSPSHDYYPVVTTIQERAIPVTK